MKKVIFSSIVVLSLAFCACDNGSSGGGSSYSGSGSYNPSFKGSGVSRTVSLNSEHGGVTYGYGTFYEGSMKLTCGSGTFNVSRSNRSNWKYMVMFDDGSAWYFD